MFAFNLCWKWWKYGRRKLDRSSRLKKAVIQKCRNSVYVYYALNCFFNGKMLERGMLVIANS